MANGTRRRRGGGDRPGVFLGALVLILVALFLPGWAGVIAILALVGGLVWLMSRTWPVTTPQQRMLRVIILLVLAAIAGYKITH